MTKVQELPAPDFDKDSNHALELLRCWVCDGELRVTLREKIGHSSYGGSPNDDPRTAIASTWGRLLYDVASHAANALSPEDDELYEQLLHRICASFMAEMTSPQGTPEGHHVDE